MTTKDRAPMPTYQYACTNPECGERFERVQAFTDPSVGECPVCGQPVRKVYGSVGVVFKGSGFYRTDSRAEKVGAKGAKSGESSRSGSDGSSAESAKSKSDGDATPGPASAGSSSTSGSGRSSTSGSSDGRSRSTSGTGSGNGTKAAASA
jgi:putative FmdB family regulatory protein